MGRSTRLPAQQSQNPRPLTTMPTALPVIATNKQLAAQLQSVLALCSCPVPAGSAIKRGTVAPPPGFPSEPIETMHIINTAGTACPAKLNKKMTSGTLWRGSIAASVVKASSFTFLWIASHAKKTRTRKVQMTGRASRRSVH